MYRLAPGHSAGQALERNGFRHRALFVQGRDIVGVGCTGNRKASGRFHFHDDIFQRDVGTGIVEVYVQRKIRTGRHVRTAIAVILHQDIGRCRIRNSGIGVGGTRFLRFRSIAGQVCRHHIFVKILVGGGRIIVVHAELGFRPFSVEEDVLKLNFKAKIFLSCWSFNPINRCECTGIFCIKIPC